MHKNASLLILGYRQGLLDACQRLGVRTTTIINAHQKSWNLPPCRADEYRVFVEKLSDLDHVMCALARADQMRFDAVYTPNEHGVILASLLGLALARPWMIPDVGVAFRDKYHQKRLLRGIVPVADAWPIEDLHDFEVDADYPYPLILKPVSGSGTFYTERVGSRDELERAIAMYRSDREAPRSMVLERYISGEEWHLDGWISAGRLRQFAVSRYSFPLIGIKQGGIVQSVMLRPEENREIYRRADEFLTTVLAGLGLSDGVFHLELFYDADTGSFIFSECGARIGGGFVPQAFAAMFGSDLYEVAVRIALGQEVEANDQPTTRYTGFTFLPAIAGQSDSLLPLELLKELPGVLDVEYEIAAGESVPDMTQGTSLRAGIALISGVSEQQVRERIASLLSYFRLSESAISVE